MRLKVLAVTNRTCQAGLTEISIDLIQCQIWSQDESVGNENENDEHRYKGLIASLKESTALYILVTS